MKRKLTDPADGLPIADEIGEWVKEKHERLRKYVDIARQARWKYVDPARPANYRGGASYIDLFCGPGRARIKGTNDIIDGSPIVAFRSASEGKAPFSDIHLADIDPAFSSAAAKRISNLGGVAHFYSGPAEQTAREIVARLNPHGLHFAFLDPYNLADLSFEIIRSLSELKRIDFLMHVSVQDLQRNTDRYTAEDATAFDRFAPGWRNTVSTNQSLATIRIGVLEHWRALVSGLGFLESRSTELVRGSRNQRLYWLAFASRNRKANDFWNKIRNISHQRELGL